MNRTKLIAVALGANSLFNTLNCWAAITVFASRESWSAAVGAHQTEDFESVLDLTPLPFSGGVFSTEHFDILVDANHGRIGAARDGFFNFPTPGVSGTFFVGDVHGPTSPPPHFNTMRFSQPVIAFAANFAALDDGGVRDISIAGESFDIRGEGTSVAQFFGIVSTTPFSTVDIRNLDPILERYGMDNVSFKFVPEPSTLALLLLGACPFARRDLVIRPLRSTGQRYSNSGRPALSACFDLIHASSGSGSESGNLM
jgi:hypothetical protein